MSQTGWIPVDEASATAGWTPVTETEQDQVKNRPSQIAPQPINAQNMQTSLPPQVVRNAGIALPVIGGTVGALGGAAAGAAAGGVTAFAGAPVGAALGAGAGETARQGIMNRIFGGKEDVAPTSKAGLTQTGIAAGTAGALEVPAGILQGMGNVWLKQLATAKSSKQVGDVIAAFEEHSPAALSKGGFTKKLFDVNEALSKELTPALANAPGTRNIDQIVAPIRAEAQLADQSVRGVSKNVEQTIQAAKYNAGITGNTATAQQLADFNNYLRDVKKVYTSSTSANITATSNPILLKADQAIRGNIRQMSPQAADIYDQMTDVHAALSAVKNFKPGLIKSAGITAATHPMTTAALSPLAVPAAVAASEVVKPAAQKIKGMIPF